MTDTSTISGVAVALPLPNIDTDTIIPIEDCINRERPHFGAALFRHWRYHVDGREIADFPLNRAPCRDATVLLAGPNFGCGSSREMAVWALADFGIRAIIAPGYGEIFYNNCFQNGVLAAIVSTADAAALNDVLTANEGLSLKLDVRARSISGAGPSPIRFALDELRADMLLRGLDPIAATLTRAAEIDAFEARDRVERPWAQMRVAKREHD